jgi:hypothetical protein
MLAVVVGAAAAASGVAPAAVLAAASAGGITASVLDGAKFIAAAGAMDVVVVGSVEMMRGLDAVADGEIVTGAASLTGFGAGPDGLPSLVGAGAALGPVEPESFGVGAAGIATAGGVAGLAAGSDDGAVDTALLATADTD